MRFEFLLLYSIRIYQLIMRLLLKMADFLLFLSTLMMEISIRKLKLLQNHVKKYQKIEFGAFSCNVFLDFKHYTRLMCCIEILRAKIFCVSRIPMNLANLYIRLQISVFQKFYTLLVNQHKLELARHFLFHQRFGTIKSMIRKQMCILQGALFISYVR